MKKYITTFIFSIMAMSMNAQIMRAEELEKYAKENFMCSPVPVIYTEQLPLNFGGGAVRSRIGKGGNPYGTGNGTGAL